MTTETSAAAAVAAAAAGRYLVVAALGVDEDEKRAATTRLRRTPPAVGVDRRDGGRRQHADATLAEWALERHALATPAVHLKHDVTR